MTSLELETKGMVSKSFILLAWSDSRSNSSKGKNILKISILWTYLMKGKTFKIHAQYMFDLRASIEPGHHFVLNVIIQPLFSSAYLHISLNSSAHLQFSHSSGHLQYPTRLNFWKKNSLLFFLTLLQRIQVKCWNTEYKVEEFFDWPSVLELGRCTVHCM